MFDEQQPRYICRKMTDNVARNVDLSVAFAQIPNTEYETQNTKYTPPICCKMTDNVARNVDSTSTFVQARGLLLRSHASNVDF